MAHVNIKERGFSIGTFHASKKLRRMCIALNQPIYSQANFEQANYVSVSNRLVPDMTRSFSRPI